MCVINCGFQELYCPIMFSWPFPLENDPWIKTTFTKPEGNSILMYTISFVRVNLFLLQTFSDLNQFFSQICICNCLPQYYHSDLILYVLLLIRRNLVIFRINLYS